MRNTIKKYIKKNYKEFLSYFVFFTCLFAVTYKLPYYIHTGGGVINTNDKIKIADEYKSDGKFNFAYVESRNAILPLYIIAKFNDNWDIEKISDLKVDDSDTVKDINFRDKLDLKISIASATINAYKLAGKDINIKSIDNYIVYLKDKKKTNLQVGDILISVDGKSISNLDDIKKIVSTKNIGDKITVLVKRDNKEKECYVTVFSSENQKMIGVSIMSLPNYETDPKLDVKFSKNESGPSGGLMLGLTIYDKLTEDDLTNGLNIVGSGTIDNTGNVGAIGGVKYKLQGAVKNKADVFIAANEENYDKCIKLKKEKNYDIKIIGVDTLEDAINKLKNLK